MAEATNIVPVPAGTLTDEDYEEMIVAAMPSPVETQVAPTLVVTETEKPAEARKKRICKICRHEDGNSVGRIKRGRVARRWDNLRGIWVYYMDWYCQLCLDKEVELPEVERDSRPVLVSGQLYAIVIKMNKIECEKREVRLAKEKFFAVKADWLVILAGEKAFQDHKAEAGYCEFIGCKDKIDGETFAVANGALRRFCRLHAETLRELKAGQQNKDPRFMAWRGPEAPAKCQRHLAWLKRQAEEEERRVTPASPQRVEGLKYAFDRFRSDGRSESSDGESEASRRAKERQAAYVAALKNGGSLADVLAVPEKSEEDDGGWAEIQAFNARSDATCAGKRKKGGGKKDGKDKGGKNKRR